MSDTSIPRQKELAVIAYVVAKAQESGVRIGRTALMKLLYFAMALKEAPLEYHFKLYTYGPFDPDVLQDLELAGSLKAVNIGLEVFPKGYAYVLERGERSDEIQGYSKAFLEKVHEALDWVVESFGNRPASELETLSTLVHVQRANAERGEKLTMERLVRKVKEIKPQLSEERLTEEARALRERGMLAVAM